MGAPWGHPFLFAWFSMLVVAPRGSVESQGVYRPGRGVWNPRTHAEVHRLGGGVPEPTT